MRSAARASGLVDAKMVVTAHCQNPRCHRRQELDLGMLKIRLGPDVPAMADDLKPKLRCGKCGGKAIGLIYSPKTAI